MNFSIVDSSLLGTIKRQDFTGFKPSFSTKFFINDGVTNPNNKIYKKNKYSNLEKSIQFKKLPIKDTLLKGSNND